MSEDAKVRFLCGCAIPLDSFSGGAPITQDDELFVLCPLHMVRRHGWRSPLVDAYQAHPVREGHTINRPNWSRTEQENEVEFWNRLGIDILKTAIEATVEEKIAEDVARDLVGNGH